MSWQRHFLALVPDEPARKALAALPLPPGARPVDPADLHLTLAFLGTLDDAGETRVLGVGARVVREPRLQGLVARLDAVEFWRGPAILCAVAPEGPDPLAPLGEALAAGLREGAPDIAPPPDERPFRSHVTLARRAPRGPGRREAVAPAITWPVRELVLMASRTGADARPRYVVRASRPFQYEGTR